MGINIFLHMRENGCLLVTPVSDYPDSHQGLRSVSALEIITVLWVNTTRIGAARLGFDPEDVGLHSLRSGGAMAMHIDGVPDRTLMGIGQ